MTKKRKILLSLLSLGTTAIAAGAIGGVVANTYSSSIKQTTGDNWNTGGSVADNNTVSGNDTNTGGAATDNNIVTGNDTTNENTNVTIANNAFNASIKKITSRSADTEEQYVLTVEKNTKVEGAIYIIDPTTGEQVSQLVVKPGELIKVGVVFNEGYENYTVRDLKIYGVNPNYTVPTEQVKGQKDQFAFKLPTMEEQKDMEGNNMFYDTNGSEIHMEPSFIISSIGDDTNWEHGAFYQTINGYVYSMQSDMMWSDLVSHIADGQFENTDKTNPINIFVYLNGHTLTVNSNEKIVLPSATKSGWALHFYNNNTDSEDATYGYGKIVPEKTNESANFDLEGQMNFDGSIALGRSVQYNMIPWHNGIKFLDLNNNDWIGATVNNPNK